jgi:hypothetical protein
VAEPAGMTEERVRRSAHARYNRRASKESIG